MRKIVFLMRFMSMCCFFSLIVQAQNTEVSALDSLLQDGGVCPIHKIYTTDSFDNIKVQKLYSDSLATTSMIWVKEGVKAHKHEYHTEQVYVIDGAATMTLGEDTLDIYTGDWIFIPKGVVHSVTEVHGNRPIQVMSIQTPLFVGKDRVFVE